jgi:hypothetical protein
MASRHMAILLAATTQGRILTEAGPPTTKVRGELASCGTNGNSRLACWEFPIMRSIIPVWDASKVLVFA